MAYVHGFSYLLPDSIILFVSDRDPAQVSLIFYLMLATPFLDLDELNLCRNFLSLSLRVFNVQRKEQQVVWSDVRFLPDEDITKI
jgi:hypothetical protein